jgi:hypothetical protein
MINVSTHQKNITIINTYAPKSEIPTYIKQT